MLAKSCTKGKYYYEISNKFEGDYCPIPLGTNDYKQSGNCL